MDWNPGAKYQKLVALARELLRDEQRTVRDIYYALEARGYDFKYREVKRAVKKGRRAGMLDPARVVDESRKAEAYVSEGYDDAESFIESQVEGIWEHYDENHWRDQDVYIEVWLEKQSLASIYRPICRKYNVRLEATRGDWSDSKVFEATNRLGNKITEGKHVRILYHGDFNPSGYHAPVAVQQTMWHYGIQLPGRDPSRDYDPYYFDIMPLEEPEELVPGNEDIDEADEFPTIQFERIALTTEHIETFDLPENPNPSSSDKDKKLRDRFKREVSGNRDVNVELNALKEYQREFLEELIEDSIVKHIDMERWNETSNRIAERRSELEGIVSINTNE